MHVNFDINKNCKLMKKFAVLATNYKRQNAKQWLFSEWLPSEKTFSYLQLSQVVYLSSLAPVAQINEGISTRFIVLLLLRLSYVFFFFFEWNELLYSKIKVDILR